MDSSEDARPSAASADGQRPSPRSLATSQPPHDNASADALPSRGPPGSHHRSTGAPRQHQRSRQQQRSQRSRAQAFVAALCLALSAIMSTLASPLRRTAAVIALVFSGERLSLRQVRQVCTALLRAALLIDPTHTGAGTAAPEGGGGGGAHVHGAFYVASSARPAALAAPAASGDGEVRALANMRGGVSGGLAAAMLAAQLAKLWPGLLGISAGVLSGRSASERSGASDGGWSTATAPPHAGSCAVSAQCGMQSTRARRFTTSDEAASTLAVDDADETVSDGEPSCARAYAATASAYVGRFAQGGAARLPPRVPPPRQEQMPARALARVLVVGDVQVGKSWLLHRFAQYAAEEAAAEALAALATLSVLSPAEADTLLHTSYSPSPASLGSVTPPPEALAPSSEATPAVPALSTSQSGSRSENAATARQQPASAASQSGLLTSGAVLELSAAELAAAALSAPAAAGGGGAGAPRGGSDWWLRRSLTAPVASSLGWRSGVAGGGLRAAAQGAADDDGDGGDDDAAGASALGLAISTLARTLAYVLGWTEPPDSSQPPAPLAPALLPDAHASGRARSHSGHSAGRSAGPDDECESPGAASPALTERLSSGSSTGCAEETPPGSPGHSNTPHLSALRQPAPQTAPGPRGHPSAADALLNSFATIRPPSPPAEPAVAPRTTTHSASGLQRPAALSAALANVRVLVIVADSLQPADGLGRYADGYVQAVRSLVHAAARSRHRRAAKSAANAAAAEGSAQSGSQQSGRAARPPPPPFTPPRVQCVLVCNKTDLAACSLLTAEAVAKAGLPFVAVSARNQTNTRHLWRMVHAALLAEDADEVSRQAETVELSRTLEAEAGLAMATPALPAPLPQ
ncbi:hypothetical protein T492DRAFT_970586 [Pavlovales sp. CCMP2436]|nr:hypothetical protein T492DRAFT_970586 [Pavlovales sp. CCMP2436]